jgi:hypothetical protein
MAGDATPLSLRPFPVADKKPKSISDFIGRINTQPGGFRDVTEAKLRDEIARQAQAGVPNEDVNMSDGEEEDDEEEEDTDEVEVDPLQAREQVLREIESVFSPNLHDQELMTDSLKHRSLSCRRDLEHPVSPSIQAKPDDR